MIKDIGSTARLNESGIIINDSDWEKVAVDYRPAIDEIVQTLIFRFSSVLHSVYLRGSLPRGLGIGGISDIDLLVVCESGACHQEIQETVRGIERKFVSEYPFVNGIEAGIYDLKDIIDTSRFGIIPFMIKTYSIPLYGHNLQKILPSYYPDDKLANEHIFNLQDQVSMALKDLDGNEDREDVKDCCMWIMKIIIRCGMAFVMKKENTYTRDLYPAFKLFSKHYHLKEKEMKQALVYAITPSEDTAELISFLKDGFGKWVVEEAEEWLNEHNPERMSRMPL
jgi:uncharacterized protein